MPTQFFSVSNIREAFQVNPGAWMVPMDMAQLEMYNNAGPTRMIYFVSINHPELSLVRIFENDQILLDETLDCVWNAF